MQSRCSGFLIVVALFFSALAWAQIQGTSAPNAPVQQSPRNGGDFSSVTNPDPKKVIPKDTIIVKGAWYSASDSTTAVPEGGSVTGNTFTNQYFGVTYPLPANWFQKYSGPPPSDSGRYVLAELRPKDSDKGTISGHMEIFAQDMFFSPFPAKNAVQMINYSKNHLPDIYKLEMKPTEAKIAGQTFTFYAYWSPAAELHWYVVATEIRCHTVEIVMTSRDTKLLESLLQDLNKMKLPAEASPTGGTGGGNVPVCIKDYATADNVIERVEPTFLVNRFNPIPVRIIVDKEGKIKHVHILSAFPEQEKAIYDALKQWKFRPYERDGQRMEVETGIMFGRAPRWNVPETDTTAAKD
jgi:hypothetical protein